MSSRSGDHNQIVTVFQVATGNVGSQMIKRIQSHPDLELVGLHCYSPDKVGTGCRRDRRDSIPSV